MAYFGYAYKKNGTSYHGVGLLVEYLFCDNVELANMNNVDLARMNKVKLASMDNVVNNVVQPR